MVKIFATHDNTEVCLDDWVMIVQSMLYTEARVESTLINLIFSLDWKM